MTKPNLKSFMKAKVAQTDEAHLEPKDRAELVHAFLCHALGITEAKEVLEQPLYWDLLCYSSQMLMNHAIALEDEGFLQVIKALNSFIHSIHYSGVVGEESFLGPGREEHERIWNERIEDLIEGAKHVKECFTTFPEIDKKKLEDLEKGNEIFKAQYESYSTKDQGERNEIS